MATPTTMTNPAGTAPKPKKKKVMTKKTKKRLAKHHERRMKAAKKMNKQLDAFDDWFDGLNGAPSGTESESSDCSSQDGSDAEELVEDSSDEEELGRQSRPGPCRGGLKARKSGELELLFAAVKPKPEIEGKSDSGAKKRPVATTNAPTKPTLAPMMTAENRRKAQLLTQQRKSSKRQLAERRQSISNSLGKHLDASADSTDHTASTMEESSSEMTDSSSMSSTPPQPHTVAQPQTNRRNRLHREGSNYKAPRLASTESSSSSPAASQRQPRRMSAESCPSSAHATAKPPHASSMDGIDGNKDYGVDCSSHSTRSSSNARPYHIRTTSATALSMVAASQGAAQQRRQPRVMKRRGSNESDYTAPSSSQQEGEDNGHVDTMNSPPVPMTPRRSAGGGSVAGWQKRIQNQHRPPPPSPAALSCKSPRGLRHQPEVQLPPAFQSICSPRASNSTRSGRRSLDRESSTSNSNHSRSPGGLAGRKERLRSKPKDEVADLDLDVVTDKKNDSEQEQPCESDSKATTAVNASLKKRDSKHDDQEASSHRRGRTSESTDGTTGGDKPVHGRHRRSTEREVGGRRTRSTSASCRRDERTMQRKFSRGSLQSTLQQDQNGGDNQDEGSVHSRHTIAANTDASKMTPKQPRKWQRRVSDDAASLPPAFQSIAAACPRTTGGSVRTARRSIDRESERERRRSRSTSVSGLRERKERIRNSSQQPSKARNTSREKAEDLEDGNSDLNYAPLKAEEQDDSTSRNCNSLRTTRRSIDREVPRERRARSTSASGMRERKERLRASYQQAKRKESSEDHGKDGTTTTSGDEKNKENNDPPRLVSTWEKREALKRQSWDQRAKIAHSMNVAMGDNDTQLPPAFRHLAKKK